MSNQAHYQSLDLRKFNYRHPQSRHFDPEQQGKSELPPIHCRGSRTQKLTLKNVTAAPKIQDSAE